MKQFFLTLTLLFFSFSASAGWPTIEGQLVDSLGEPILESNVDFKVEIFAPGTSCKMSEETFDNGSSGYNLSESRGSFALSLGNSGNTPVFPGAGPDSYDEVFKAGGSGDDGGACNAAMPSGAERDVRVSYSVNGGPYNSINSNLRYGGAASAATLNGIPASDFLRDNGSNTNQANLDSIMNALFGGSPNQDDVLKYDSGSWVVGSVPGGGGGVTSITPGEGLTGTSSPITATGTISVDINGTMSETSVATADELLIYDTSVTALRKMTHANFLNGVVPAELSQVANIDSTTISAAQWGYLGAMTGQPLESESDPGLQTLSTAEVDQLENIDTVTVTNTQWGYLGAMTGQPLESESDPGLQTLSTAEVDQLENIDAVTITNTQWGYLGAMTGQPLEVAPPPGPTQTDEPSGATTGEWELIGNSGEASSFLFRVAPVTPATGNGAYSEAQGVCAGISSQTNRGIAKLCSIEQLQRACVEDKLNDDNGGSGQHHASSNLSGATSVFSLYILDGSVDNNYSDCQVSGTEVNFFSASQKFYCCIE